MTDEAPSATSRHNLRREIAGAVVLVPGDLVVAERCRHDVDVAIAVKVAKLHIIDLVCGRRNDIKREVLRAVVFEPRDLVLVHPGRDDVGVAITVDVSSFQVPASGIA